MNARLLVSALPYICCAAVLASSQAAGCYCRNGGAINRLYVEYEKPGKQAWSRRGGADPAGEDADPARFRARVLANASLAKHERICCFCFKKMAGHAELLGLLQRDRDVDGGGEAGALRCYLMCPEGSLQKSGGLGREIMSMSLGRRGIDLFAGGGTAVLQTRSGRGMLCRGDSIPAAKMFFRMERGGFEVLREKLERQRIEAKRADRSVDGDSPARYSGTQANHHSGVPPLLPVTEESVQAASAGSPSAADGGKGRASGAQVPGPDGDPLPEEAADSGDEAVSGHSEGKTPEDPQPEEGKPPAAPLVLMALFVLVPLAGVLAYLMRLQCRKHAPACAAE